MNRIPTEQEWRTALAERHGTELQEKLDKSAVAICGLGGLGSNIAVSLARAGVGKLILTDFDKVDITNLHRQQYKAAQLGMYKTDALRENLLEIAPYVSIVTHTVRIDEFNCRDLLTDADIVCEAFDDACSKAMLVNTVLENFPRKTIVAASGMAGIGPANLVHTRKITGRFILCGDESSDVNDGMGLVAPRVMLCAAHQALAVIRKIAGEKEL